MTSNLHLQTVCPIWVRLLCILYDLMLTISCLIVGAFLLFLLFSSLENHPNKNTILQGYAVTVISIYYIGFWIKGQTPAMRVWKLHWQNDNGQKKTPYHRLILRFILSIIAIPGMILYFFNKKHLTLVDYLCGSTLIRIKTNQTIKKRTNV